MQSESERLEPVHPGEVILEEFMKPLGLSVYRVAKDLKVPVSRIEAIIKRKRRLSADTILRLERYFGLSAQFWINLQNHYLIECAKAHSKSSIERITPFARTTAESPHY